MVDSKAMGPTLVDGKAVGGADILDVIIDPSQTEISDGEPGFYILDPTSRTGCDTECREKQALVLGANDKV